MKRWRNLDGQCATLIAIATLVFLSAPGLAHAQQEAPPAEKQEEPAPTEQPPTEEPEERETEEQEAESDLETLPDLDDLLGLEPADDVDDSDVDPDQAELERLLDAQQAADAFAQAVTQMRDAAELLEVAHDPGLRTQRTQEEILKRLDVLIEQAQQNQSSSSSQSSSSQPRPQQRSGQQQQQAAQSQASQGAQGDNTQEMLPPGGQSGRLNDVLDAARAAWGSLPPRVRDTLLQGSSDRFSSLYESLTEAYYRRLAEEAGGS